jgi:hypothetical protein
MIDDNLVNSINRPAGCEFSCSDTLIIVRIIEGSHNGGSDNHGSTVPIINNSYYL